MLIVGRIQRYLKLFSHIWFITNKKPIVMSLKRIVLLSMTLLLFSTFYQCSYDGEELAPVKPLFPTPPFKSVTIDEDEGLQEALEIIFSNYKSPVARELYGSKYKLLSDTVIVGKDYRNNLIHYSLSIEERGKANDGFILNMIVSITPSKKVLTYIYKHILSSHESFEGTLVISDLDGKEVHRSKFVEYGLHKPESEGSDNSRTNRECITVDYYSQACSAAGCSSPKYMYSDTECFGLYGTYGTDGSGNLNGAEKGALGGGTGGPPVNTGGGNSGSKKSTKPVDKDTPWDNYLNEKKKIKNGIYVPDNVWKNLTDEEKKLLPDLRKEEIAILNNNIWAWPLYLGNAVDAYAFTIAYFPNNGPSMTDNDNSNAFKHAMWSATNTMVLGRPLAKQLGDAHEAEPNQHWPKQMDLHNNDVGRSIGNAINSSNTLVDRQCYKACKDGRLMRLNSTKNGLIPTNGKDGE